MGATCILKLQIGNTDSLSDGLVIAIKHFHTFMAAMHYLLTTPLIALAHTSPLLFVCSCLLSVLLSPQGAVICSPHGVTAVCLLSQHLMSAGWLFAASRILLQVLGWFAVCVLHSLSARSVCCYLPSQPHKCHDRLCALTASQVSRPFVYRPVLIIRE